jgi:hypothetical protein
LFGCGQRPRRVPSVSQPPCPSRPPVRTFRAPSMRMLARRFWYPDSPDYWTDVLILEFRNFVNQRRSDVES